MVISNDVFPSVIYCTLPPIQQCRGQKQTSTCRFVQTLRGCRSHDGRSQSLRLSPGTESEGRGSGDQHATSLRSLGLSTLACLSLARDRAELGRRLVRGICIDIPGPPTDRPACIWRRLLSVQSGERGGQKETSWHSKAPNARPTEVLEFQQAILALLGLLQIAATPLLGCVVVGITQPPLLSSPHHEIFRSLSSMLSPPLQPVVRHASSRLTLENTG